MLVRTGIQRAHTAIYYPNRARAERLADPHPVFHRLDLCSGSNRNQHISPGDNRVPDTSSSI